MANYTYHHLHLISADPDAAASFLQDAFGATLQKRSTGPDGTTMIMLELGGSGVFVKGRAEKPTVQAPAPGSTYGLEHFGIITDDLDAAVAELKAKGIKFVQDITNFRPGVRISFLLGPDDILIELLEITPV
jgi:catechol 2,3-dioxygenase-like lactoylglutathione lyase family enzyme